MVKPLTWRLAVICAALVLFGLVAVPIASATGADWKMALLAWFACFAGALGGHAASEYPKGNMFVMVRLAAGMVCRTLLPLAFAVWAVKVRQPRVAGAVIVVLVFGYLVGLLVDSILSLQRIEKPGSPSVQ